MRIRPAAVAAKGQQRIPVAAVGMKPAQKIAAAMMTAVLTGLFRRDVAQIVQRNAASIGEGVYRA